MQINSLLTEPQGEIRLLRRTDICSDLAISAATFYRLVSEGEIPQPIKIGRAARWKSTDIKAFVEARASETSQVEKCREQAAQ